MNTRIALVLALVLSSWPSRASQEFLVVVHPSNAATSLPREQVARYFLKKTTSWPDRRPVVPVDQPESSAVREAFSRLVLDKRITEVKAYWQQQIFSGRAVPPAVRSTDAQVIDAVRESAGAIAYVSPGADTRGVKVVELTD
jgi:ABC-type phosphate transport system substrate-binding protein